MRSSCTYGKGTETAAFGELSLDGHVRYVHGALGRLLSLKEQGIRHVIGPAACEREANAVDSIRYEGVSTLKEAVLRYSGVSSPKGDVAIASAPEDAHDLEILIPSE